MDSECNIEQDQEQELYGPRPDEPYRMTVDLNVIDHLGLNLYSNISAVLTEAVANAWDADASEVGIDVDVEHDTITIVDDGVGMTKFDMNKKYLHVGFRRRAHEDDVTSKGRPVMGRKGLGKLSLFSLADLIEVQSAKDGERHGLVMDVMDMRLVCQEHASKYVPKPIPDDKITVEKGTRITLHRIKRPRLEQSLETLRMQLARRFSVIGEAYGFKVSINGQQITVDDRCELKTAQFLWTIGGATVDIPNGHQIVERFEIPGDGTDTSPTGWIATAREPKLLVSNGSNLNGIVVLARGRLIQEDIFSKFNDGRIYTKYLTGQISYDLLDDTTAGVDVATSDRQRIKEDDPRYLKLLEYVKGVLRQVESQWNEHRPKHEIKSALDKYPVLVGWLDNLKPGTRKTAEKMVAKVAALPVDHEEDRKTLLKHSVYAFERMELRGSECEFVNGLSDIETLLSLLSDRDALEASLYHEIVRSRLNAIRNIRDLVDANLKEKMLQRYLFDHLWLLDTSWERANDSTTRMEESLGREFENVGDVLAPDERKGRLDIRYKTSAGSHIIVELKKADRLVDLPELLEQGQKYKSALLKCLSNCGEPHADVQIVFVLGRQVKEASNDALGGVDYVTKSLAPLNARIVYYDEMIVNAQKAYAEYLEKDRKLNVIDSVVDQL